MKNFNAVNVFIRYERRVFERNAASWTDEFLGQLSPNMEIVSPAVLSPVSYDCFCRLQQCGVVHPSTGALNSPPAAP